MKKEQFHKLKQLNRIEYLLASDREQKSFSDNIITFRVIGIIFYMWFILFSTGMLFYIGFENIAILKLLWVLNFKSIFFWGLFLSMAMDAYTIYTHRKRVKDLDNFFLKREGIK